MRHTGETVPASGSEADGDLTPDFTYSDWAADLLRDLGDEPAPQRADGWCSIADLKEQAVGLTEDQLRKRIRQKVASGEYDHINHLGKLYVRIKR
jgi:hypothetical protein